MKVLIKCYANVDVTTGESPLHTSILRNNLEAVQLLVKHRASVNKCQPSDDFTPLWACIENGKNIEIAKFLVGTKS